MGNRKDKKEKDGWYGWGSILFSVIKKNLNNKVALTSEPDGYLWGWVGFNKY